MIGRNILLSLCALLWSSGAVSAERPQSDVGQSDKVPAARTNALPPDTRTSGQIVLQGRTVKYTAIAGSLPATDATGERRGDISFIAYIADYEQSSRRPLTFFFNGGPGVSSATLNVVGLGPKRLASRAPSSQPALVDNPDSWLDFTDMVFVDPIGTGWSRATGGPDEARKYFWGVQQDIDSLSRFIVDWIVKQQRLQSPKYLVGESYGGFRAPRIARRLLSLGIGVSGFVMVSPAIDFVSARGGESPLWPAILLPSYAAGAIERATGKDVDPAQLADAEHYALTEYATDLLRGVNDQAALSRMSENVSRYTGLPPELVRRLGGRIDPTTFRRENWRDKGEVGSIMDASTTIYDPDPGSAELPQIDASMSGSTATASAVIDYVANVLRWKVDAPYYASNPQVGMSWDWNSEGFVTPGLDATHDLREMLALNADLQVLVAHGATDLNTAYLGSKLILDQIPDFGNAHRLGFKLYPGGHVFYSRDRARHAFHGDARSLYARRKE
jgi:carboxypeptidase C (cathepsin A)